MVFSGVISFPRPYAKEGAPSCGIYLIAPKPLRVSLFVPQLRAVIAALNTSRYEKHMHALEMKFSAKIYEKERRDAVMLVELCKHNGIVPIIRNDLGLCVEAGADGVMLNSSRDMEKARHILGERAIIGVDCGNKREEARAALAGGVDYIGFSRFFSQNVRTGADLPLLEWWASQTPLPAAALGNLSVDRAIALARAGAGFIAAGSWVWNHKEGPARAIHWLQEAIEHGLSMQRNH